MDGFKLCGMQSHAKIHVRRSPYVWKTLSQILVINTVSNQSFVRRGRILRDGRRRVNRHGISKSDERSGMPYKDYLKCDASAAVGIVKRRGLGRIRHIDVTQLWLQEKVAEGVIEITKVNTKENVSDGLTKGVSGSEVSWLMSQVSQHVKQ